MTKYGEMVKSQNCDRIRAAVIALENWDQVRKFCEEPVEFFQLEQWQCGTSACAGGFLALLPEFNAQGLKLEKKSRAHPSYVAFRHLASFSALAVFFGIALAESQDWFYYYGTNDVTPQMVANKMRKYLRKIGEETGTVARKASERRSNYLTRKLGR